MEEKICFVIMGFGKKTDLSDGVTIDLDKTYQNIIKPSVTESGYKCVRADEVQDTGLIDRSMYALILKADLVIADISTFNPNALYELGVRHAVKPYTTIIIKAESTSKIPFDIDHTRVFSYKHLGEDIGVDESNRMKKLLKEKIANIDNSVPIKDSPVYAYLQTLTQPTIDDDEYKDIVGILAEKNECLFALTENARILMHDNKFEEAAKYWKKASQKNTNEPYYIQQLALCTYKQNVTDDKKEMYLNDALRILDVLKDSNDPETFGLIGAIYKRLSKINNDNLGYLDRAIENYEKGYMLNYDFYTGENLAYCYDKKSFLLEDDEEKIYCKIQAKKIREKIYKILSEKFELEDICKIPNIKWMSATYAICCYTCNEIETGYKYEKYFKSIAKKWEIDTFDEQKKELEQLLNTNFNYGKDL